MGGLPGIYQVFHESNIGISPAKDWDDGKQHQGLDDGTVFAGEKVDFFMPICLVWEYQHIETLRCTFKHIA